MAEAIALWKDLKAGMTQDRNTVRHDVHAAFDEFESARAQREDEMLKRQQARAKLKR